jgi:3-keto-disaccharide hydrolase
MTLYHFHSLLTEKLAGWQMAGRGGFRAVAEGVIESYGGPGLLWYEREIFENFILRIEWRTLSRDANSGVFIRFPPLAHDPQPAIDRGYEIQIDAQGIDPEHGKTMSPLHMTGAIYKLAPARIVTSRGTADWNEFEVTARGGIIDVLLNGEVVSRLPNASREPRGHIGLQAHHDGSHVQFRNLQVRRFED